MGGSTFIIVNWHHNTSFAVGGFVLPKQGLNKINLE